MTIMLPSPITLAATLALCCAAGSCRKSVAANTDDAGPSAAAAARVVGNELILLPTDPQLSRLATVSAAPVVLDSLDIPGRVAWDEDATVRVFSPFAGRVVRVIATVGQRIRAGDTLALIASPDYGQAQADARRAATDLALARRTLERTRDLLQHGVAAQKDLEGAEADLQRAEAEQERTVGKLAMYGTDASSMNQAFALRAPLGGLVVDRSLTPGQEVRPDQMLANAPQLFAPLFVITDPERAWVVLDVPERDLPLVSNGASIQVQPSAWPTRSLSGRITFVAGAIDPATRTLKVRGTVTNPHGLLKAEMLVTVHLASSGAATIGIPAGAVLLEGGERFVYVEESKGHLRRLTVTVGSTQHGVVQVLSGLTLGQRVVTNGALLVEQLFTRTRQTS